MPSEGLREPVIVECLLIGLPATVRISKWLVGECLAAVPFGDNADVTAIHDVENAVAVNTDHVSTGREHHIIATRDLHIFAIHS